MRIETGIARLTADPELRTVNGKNGEVAIATFNIAKNFGYGDNEKTNYIRVEFWGKRGEVIAKHFKKGNRIIIFGDLEFDQWEKDGKKGSAHKIRGVDFEFVDYKEDGESNVQPEAKKTTTKKAEPETAEVDADDENPFAD